MQHSLLFRLALYSLLITASPSFAGKPDATITRYTIESPFGPNDHRGEYDRKLLELALKKTTSKYGPYVFLRAPQMNQVRAVESMSKGAYPNFVRVLGYDKSLKEKGLRYIDFPIFRGLLGYRTCFYANAIKDRLATMLSTNDLKQFTFGVGSGWIDDKILQHNGYKTLVASDYESMFELTASGRFELFCRGANEVLEEFKTHRELQGLHYDRSFYLHYPMRHFYYFSKLHEKDMKRVKEGLDIAAKDGSFVQLWKEYHASNLVFLQLKDREEVALKNPEVEGIEFSYNKLLFTP